MRVRRVTRIVACSLLLAAPAGADKLDKDSKKWLDDVSALTTALETGEPWPPVLRGTT